MSLIASRRYLLASGVERWSAKQAEPVVEALATLPPDLTIVLVAHEDPPKVRPPKRLADAVAAAGGEVIAYEAPNARQLPAWLREESRRRDFELEPEAAALLVERLGEGTTRLATELDRLALWAERGGSVSRADLEQMVADTSEEASWVLSDAILDRDRAAALAAAERLADQGAAVTPLVYAVAKRLREASLALEALDAGHAPAEVEASLPMHPYAAKLLVRRVRGRTPAELRRAACAIADLEWWTRGGSDYPEPVALTLAVRRAAGAREA
jgi:DNA polymerase-3 subunit delta